jgi:hypothetical protein
MAQRFQARYKGRDSRSVPRSHGMSHNERNNQHFHIRDTRYHGPGDPTALHSDICHHGDAIMNLLRWHRYQRH